MTILCFLLILLQRKTKVVVQCHFGPLDIKVALKKNKKQIFNVGRSFSEFYSIFITLKMEQNSEKLLFISKLKVDLKALKNFNLWKSFKYDENVIFSTSKTLFVLKIFNVLWCILSLEDRWLDFMTSYFKTPEYNKKILQKNQAENEPRKLVTRPIFIFFKALIEIKTSR